MSENPNNEQHADDDPTDELPVLSEAAVAALDADVPTLADAVSSETGEHTARLLAPQRPGPRVSIGDEYAPGGRANQAISSPLERDVAKLTARWDGLEAHLDKNAAAIATLGKQLAAAQQALESSNAAQQRLLTQLEEREQGLAKALENRQLEDETALDGFANELAESATKLAELEQARNAAEASRAELGTTLEAREAALSEAREAAVEHEARAVSLAAELERQARTVGELRDELAEQRERTASLDAANARIATLERELEAALQTSRSAADAAERADVDAYRSEIASLTAYIENRRAEWSDLHATLAEHRTRIMELEQELAQRTERQIQLETTVREETERASTLRDELASLKIEFSRRADTRQDRIAQREAALQTQQGRIAELESLLEASERALGERQAELDTQAEALAEARAEREALERRLAESAEKPLSEELVDPELPVEEQSRRITTLQRELTERIDALRELQDGELQDGRRPGAVVDFGARRSEDRPATAAERFTLVCLTSDEPASYDIVKPDMTIGRSSSCDIQILTHFVSREHARLELDEDRVTLEDLGSTNGVFVNAVRVDRQILQHGDWVTIGETQFRFLDAQDS